MAGHTIRAWNPHHMTGEGTLALSEREMLELAQFAFARMDGAWFLALARELGTEAAWKMDVEAWKQFSYVFGKDMKISVEHTKNLNRGDELCEVVISK
jgi:hypothetical protein